MATYTYSGNTQQNSNAGHPNLMVALKIEPTGDPKVSILDQTVADANGDFSLQWGTDVGGEDWGGRVAIGALDDDGTVTLECVFHDWLNGIMGTPIIPHDEVVMALSPWGYWRLGELSGGTAYDSSGNNRNGTYQTGTTLGVPGLLVNDRNKAVLFDGISGEVRLGNPNTDALAAKTISAVVSTNDLTAHQIIYKDGGYGNGFAIGFYNSNLRIAIVSNYVLTYADYPVSNLGEGRRVHVAGTINSAGLELFVNGQSVASNVTSIPSHNGSCYAGIGSSYCVYSATQQSPLSGTMVPAYFDGVIDEVALFDYVLSPTEILDLYESSIAYSPYAGLLREYNPIAHWRMNDASGVTLTDYSGYDRHGLLVGAPALNVAGLVTTDDDPAAQFNGTSQYVDFSTMTDVLADMTAGFTYMCLFNFGDPTFANSAYQALGCLRTDETEGFRVFLSNNGSYNDISFGQSGKATKRVAASLSGVVHLAITWDGAAYKAYINGVDTTISASSTFLSYGNKTEIARYTDSLTNLFTGVIDEVAVFPTALSGADVLALYNVATGA